MGRPEQRYREFLRDVSRRIVAAQRPIRVLRALAWPDSVRERFLARRGRELPRPRYAPLQFDPGKVAAELGAVVERLRITEPVERILMDTCVSYIGCARMLAAIGTRDFHRWSRELYGSPGDRFDQNTTQLDLAQHLDRVLAGFTDEELGRRLAAEVGAERAAGRLRARFRRSFGRLRAPRVEVGRAMTADAAAGSDVIRLKSGRRFSRQTLDQLEQHEGYVHVATTLNGRRQRVLGVLGKGPPRVTRFQEGLAVFAELVTGCLDVARLRVLKNRVLAVKLAEDGADFRDLYRFFADTGLEPGEAFDNARRIVRGGRVEGGAPFTKDVGYLDGLLRVYHWALIATKRGRPELLRFLWVGKVTVEDVPVLVDLHRRGLVEAPRFLPPWIRDVHHLAAYLSLTGFVNRVDLSGIERSYARLLDDSVQFRLPAGTPFSPS